MTMPGIRPSAALVVAAMASMTAIGTVHAGRPLQTEDAGIIAPGGCEIEGSALRLRAGGAGATASDDGVGLNCGTGPLGQVGLRAARLRAGGERAVRATLGGKWNAWRGDGDDAVALTLAWGLGGERAEGGSWRHGDTLGALVVSAPAPGGVVHANVGRLWLHGAGGSRATTWNLAYEHDGWPLGELRWAPMGEVFGASGGQRWWNAALRLTLVADKLFVDASHGRTFSGDAARLTTVGFKLAF